MKSVCYLYKLIIKIKGYVQGMNYIAASLLYHADECISFWLMDVIFKKFEMRDIYLPS